MRKIDPFVLVLKLMGMRSPYNLREIVRLDTK